MAAGLKSPKARLKIDGVMTNVVANFVIPEDAGWAQLKDRYKKVVALWPAAGTGNGPVWAGTVQGQGPGPPEYSLTATKAGSEARF